MANYQFVIDSSFKPFEMNELLQPVLAYKEAYEQTEEAYNDLSTKANVFKKLASSLPEGSQARQIYEGYANDLNTQATDLTTNGLNMGNRRALSSLKRRYSGEIGQLEEADKAMKEEENLRRQAAANGTQMLYANDNLTIDDFLGGKKPNLYGVSSDKLRQRGMDFAKAASSRKYDFFDGGDTLGGYYKKWVAKNGYDAESINNFIANVSAIPEFQQQVDKILEETGALDNLTGTNNLDRARLSVINGMVDGAMLSMTVTPQRNLGKLTASEAADVNIKNRQLDQAERKLQEDIRGQRAAERMAAEKFKFEKQKFYAEQQQARNNMIINGWTLDQNGNPVSHNIKNDEVAKASASRNAFNTYTSARTQYNLYNRYGTYFDSNGKPVSNNSSSVSLGSTAKHLTGNNAKQYKVLKDNGGNTTKGNYFIWKDGRSSIANKKYRSNWVKPIYFDAWSDNSKIDLKTSNDANMNDLTLISGKELNKVAKAQLIPKIKELLPGISSGLSDNQLEKVLEYMPVWKDTDWFTDNHFILGVPGYGPDGAVSKESWMGLSGEEAFNAFLSEINAMKLSNINNAEKIAAKSRNASLRKGNKKK